MAINQTKPGLLNPLAAYNQARQPGGFLAPTENFQGFLTDPRASIGIQIAQGVPLGQAIFSGATQAQQLKELFNKEDDERRIVKGADGFNYYEDGTRVLPDVEQPIDTTDNTNDYQNYLNTVPLGQNPSPEGFSKFLADKATAGATRIDLSEKAEAQIGVEFAKTQLKEVGKDLEQTGNWLAESQAIAKMSEGLENFQTGALGNVRASVGSIISLLNLEYQQDPDKLSKLFNPSGSQLTESGAAVYQRELARGLQNLNLEEVKINKRITTDTTKEPYVNKIILETLKIDNNAKRQLDEAANNFLAQNLTYKDYIALKKEIKNTATKQANDVYDTVANVAKEIPKIIKKDIGTTVQAVNVNNQVVSIKVQATDKFTGQSDMSGNPVIQTINGDLYSLIVEEN